MQVNSQMFPSLIFYGEMLHPPFWLLELLPGCQDFMALKVLTDWELV